MNKDERCENCIGFSGEKIGMGNNRPVYQCTRYPTAIYADSPKCEKFKERSNDDG